MSEVAYLPLNEDELDMVVQIPFQKLVESMEEGKYYSLNEMAQKLVGKEVIGKDAANEYLNPEGLKKAHWTYVMKNVITYVNDLAYIYASLMSLASVDTLKVGFKNHMFYFCKK